MNFGVSEKEVWKVKSNLCVEGNEDSKSTPEV